MNNDERQKRYNAFSSTTQLFLDNLDLARQQVTILAANTGLYADVIPLFYNIALMQTSFLELQKLHLQYLEESYADLPGSNPLFEKLKNDTEKAIQDSIDNGKNLAAAIK